MRNKKKRLPAGELAFQVVLYVLLILLTLTFIIPFLLVIGTSFVSKEEIARRGFVFFPQVWNFAAYDMMLLQNTEVWRAYGVTFFRVVVGTLSSLLVTGTFAYAVSKKDLPGRTVLLVLSFITMIFYGGLIPTYLVVKSLGLIDSLWCFILPNLMSVWNMLILRNFFYSIPDSLEESALLDGATPPTIFFRIIVPLSMPAVATIGLFYAVDQWNNWFDAAIWINDVRKYPLQMVLRKYVLMSSTYDLKFDLATGAKPPDMGIKSAIVVISTLPMLCIYPFIQKYFVKGVMIGSVKG